MTNLQNTRRAFERMREAREVVDVLALALQHHRTLLCVIEAAAQALENEATHQQIAAILAAEVVE